MSAIAHSAASVAPAVQGKNLIVLAASATKVVFQIPPTWEQAYLTLVGDSDADIHFAFSDNPSGDVTSTAVTDTAAGSGDAVVFDDFDGSECDVVFAKGRLSVDLRAKSERAKYLVFKSSAAGFLRLIRSSGKVSG